ncbi:malonic semialdehyde reductase [Glaciihabitans sp. INWT7]|uniref:malonic semialdehyde reductase n=1 Tax=Glaciihabitans sp. INWT7 TaxID=2596912 RepID=UPI00162AC604|nr:malonic semialdehyde reductase [Glaciihabitans sp. INWT7]
MTLSSAPALDALSDAGRSLLFTEARTANTFADIPVTDAELTQIWDLAKWAPTQANLQPLRVVYVQSPEARARLVEHMSDGNKAKTLAAPAVAVLALDSRFHEHVSTVMPFMPQLEEVFEGNEDARISTARLNSALQAGYFVLAVRAQGLAAGPMSGFDAAAFDADFFPDGRLKSFMVVNIGHPGEGAFRNRLPRLDAAQVVDFA